MAFVVRFQYHASSTFFTFFGLAVIPLYDDNPTKTTPYVTIGLIVVNVIAFFYELMLPSDMKSFHAFFMNYSIVPAELFEHMSGRGPLTLVTSTFLHGGWMHLIGNMWYLWIFGNNVEDSTGPFEFILFYTLSGIIAGLLHAFSDPNSVTPTIGASGAISGVLGAYLLLFPGARMLVALTPPFSGSLGFKIVSVPAWTFLIFWFVMQLLNVLMTVGMSDTGRIAWWAHIGGFAAGMALIGILKRPEIKFFQTPAAGNAKYAVLEYETGKLYQTIAEVKKEMESGLKKISRNERFHFAQSIEKIRGAMRLRSVIMEVAAELQSRGHSITKGSNPPDEMRDLFTKLERIISILEQFDNQPDTQFISALDWSLKTLEQLEQSAALLSHLDHQHLTQWRKRKE